MENLINALSIFSYKYDLDDQQNLSSLKMSIANGYLDFNSIRNEFLKAINSDTTSWLYIALKSDLIPQIELYTNEEIRDYVSYLLFDFLVPEQAITENQKILFYSRCKEILSEVDGKWLDSKDLFVKIHEKKDLNFISYFHLHELKFKNLVFEWKFDTNKPYQIGFYRLLEKNYLSL